MYILSNDYGIFGGSSTVILTIDKNTTVDFT